MIVAQEREDERPRPGDRVKLCGNHRFAGYSAQYLGDFPTAGLGTKPMVKILETGDKVVVWDADSQMRKA
jgi:hypothetical protein